MVLGDLMVALVGGSIIGLLGKWLAPSGRDEIPLWLTVICGIGGVLIGTYAYTRLFADSTPGFDWWRHIWQVAFAAALVMSTATLMGRAATRTTRSRDRARASGRRGAR
jgi:uncharacterized membrane protein YeaQ/YmgE (transglycosylase-associated protein family)